MPRVRAAVVAYTRGTTAATGSYVVASATAATTLVVPSTATLGFANSVATYLWIYAINNSGTLELGVIANAPLDEGTRQSSTAISTAADNVGVLYSTSARTNVGVKLIGRILISEATAGTWATNATEVSVVPLSRTMADMIGTKTNDSASAGRPGEVITSRITRTNRTSITTGSPCAVGSNSCPTDGSPISLALTPGDWQISGAVGFVPAATTSVTILQVATNINLAGSLPGTDLLGSPTGGQYLSITSHPAYVPAGDIVIPIPPFQYKITVNTTIDLMAQATFTVSTMNVCGYLEARRMR